MSNTKIPFTKKKISNNDTPETTAVILLIAFIFAGSLIADKFISNNLLSLPLLISTVISTIITQYGTPKLRALRLNQIIRKEGPKQHHNKAGTPTMGGILIVPIGLIVGNLLIQNESNKHQILALTFLSLSFMLIGIYDDWRSLTLQTNTGLRPTGKLLLQSFIGTIFLFWSGWQGWIHTKIYLFSDKFIDIGFLIWPLALFVLIAESNATNLTDGLDGLASGCGALVFTGLAIQLMLRDNTSDTELAVFCIAMAGAWLGFLLHNKYPAKVFMGDTGSLTMGAALCGVALLSNSLWALLIMGGVFLCESLSVILQVLIFKITKKINGQGYRLFLMAPIHHHYELAGKSEQIIVRNFWLVTLCLVLIGLILRPTP